MGLNWKLDMQMGLYWVWRFSRIDFFITSDTLIFILKPPILKKNAFRLKTILNAISSINFEIQVSFLEL